MMKEREKMLAGEMYDPMDAELVSARKRARDLLFRYNGLPPSEEEGRSVVLRELLGGGGKSVFIEPPFHCDYGTNIHVGERFYANFDCVFLDVCEIRIGDDCMIALKVGIYTATHPIDPVLRTSGRECGKPISIGNRVWIGAGSTLLPGITIGNDVVVGAGSVVTRSFPDRVVIAGNPAKIIRHLS